MHVKWASLGKWHVKDVHHIRVLYDKEAPNIRVLHVKEAHHIKVLHVKVRLI